MDGLTIFLSVFLFALIAYCASVVIYGIRHPRTQEEKDLEQQEYWRKLRAIEKAQIEKEARIISDYYNKLIAEGMPQPLAENLTRSYQVKVFQRENLLGSPVIDDGLH